MNKVNEFRYNVLKKLKMVFDHIEVSTVFKDPNEKINTWVLNALHTDYGVNSEEVMGEYYFLPIEDDNAMFHVFYSMISLAEDIDQDKFDDLGQAANILNFFLPVGAFVFGKNDGIIAFKYTSLIPMKSSEDEAMELIDGNIGLSLQMIDQYVDLFMDLARGKITLEGFKNSLPSEFYE